MADPDPIGEPKAEEPEAAQPVRRRIAVNDAEIAAAKLRITLDRKFGRETPEGVKRIAAAK